MNLTEFRDRQLGQQVKITMSESEAIELYQWITVNWGMNWPPTLNALHDRLQEWGEDV